MFGMSGIAVHMQFVGKALAKAKCERPKPLIDEREEVQV